VFKDVKPAKESRRSVPNPFIIYQKRNIARIKLMHTKSKQMKDYSRQLSEEWRALTDVQRKPYLDEYRMLREVYEQERVQQASDEAAAAATLAATIPPLVAQ
jgi:hypothetical protein